MKAVGITTWFQFTQGHWLFCHQGQKVLAVILPLIWLLLCLSLENRHYLIYMWMQLHTLPKWWPIFQRWGCDCIPMPYAYARHYHASNDKTLAGQSALNSYCKHCSISDFACKKEWSSIFTSAPHRAATALCSPRATWTARPTMSSTMKADTSLCLKIKSRAYCVRKLKTVSLLWFSVKIPAAIEKAAFRHNRFPLKWYARASYVLLSSNNLPLLTVESSSRLNSRHVCILFSVIH